MNLPSLVSQAELDKLATPDETIEVHLIIRRVANQSAAYTLRGRHRKYLAEFDPSRGCHVLRIPGSVFMQGVPAGMVTDNPSISYDLQAARHALKSPLVIEVHPVRKPAMLAVQASAPEASKQPTEERLRLAYCDGSTAYVDGLTPVANPYTIDGQPELNAFWQSGFDDAEKAARQGEQSAAAPPDAAAPAPPDDDEAALEAKRAAARERQRKSREKKKAAAAAKKAKATA